MIVQMIVWMIIKMIVPMIVYWSCNDCADDCAKDFVLHLCSTFLNFSQLQHLFALFKFDQCCSTLLSIAKHWSTLLTLINFVQLCSTLRSYAQILCLFYCWNHLRFLIGLVSQLPKPPFRCHNIAPLLLLVSRGVVEWLHQYHSRILLPSLPRYPSHLLIHLY